MPTSTESFKNQWFHLKDWGSAQTATTSGVAGSASEEDSSKNQIDLFHTLYRAIDLCETPADVVSCIRQIETQPNIPFATHNPKMSGLKFFGFPNGALSAEYNVLIKQAKNRILDMLLNDINLTIDDDIKGFLARHRGPFSSGRTKSSEILEQIQRDRGEIGSQNIFPTLEVDDDYPFEDGSPVSVNLAANAVGDVLIVNHPQSGESQEKPTDFRLNEGFFKRAKTMLAKEKSRLQGWVNFISGSTELLFNKNTASDNDVKAIGQAACAKPQPFHTMRT